MMRMIINNFYFLLINKLIHSNHMGSILNEGLSDFHCIFNDLGNINKYGMITHGSNSCL